MDNVSFDLSFPASATWSPTHVQPTRWHLSPLLPLPASSAGSCCSLSCCQTLEEAEAQLPALLRGLSDSLSSSSGAGSHGCLPSAAASSAKERADFATKLQEMLCAVGLACPSGCRSATAAAQVGGHWWDHWRVLAVALVHGNRSSPRPQWRCGGWHGDCCEQI